MTEPAGRREFFDAVRARDHDALRALADRDPSLVFAIDPSDCCGATVMNVAVRFGDLALLDTLLELGADPDQPSDWPPGPFRALNSIPAAHLDTVGPWLIARGAALDAHAAALLGMEDALADVLARDPEALHRPGPDGQRPLHVARTPAVASFLLGLGADLEVRCVDHGSTSAEYAATGRPDVCAFLLERGARGDPFMYALIGDLPRLEAAIGDDAEPLRARVTPERFPPTEDAAGHIYMYTIGEDATLLHAAAGRGRTEVVSWLLKRGLDPDVRGGYDEQTPLHGAAWANEVGAIRALLEGGADIDRPSGPIHRNPPLGWAIVAGSAEAARALLDAGASVRPHYAADAEAGARGEFRAYASAPAERYETILRHLREATA